jgi:CheY-like chemotaxis protein
LLVITVPNLLVSDDDAAFRQVVCEALSRRGFTVSQASDGEQALEVIKHTQVHVLLLDMHMPRLTGLQVMEYMAQSPSGPPCVLMSSAMDEVIEKEAMRMRAYRVLAKPFRLSELSSVICGALSEVYNWRPPKSFA